MHVHMHMGFSGGVSGKASACIVGDVRDSGSTPGSGRSSGEENGNPFQYSYLENLMGRGTWQVRAYRIAKSQTQLRQPSIHEHMYVYIYILIYMCVYLNACVHTMSVIGRMRLIKRSTPALAFRRKGEIKSTVTMLLFIWYQHRSINMKYFLFPFSLNIFSVVSLKKLESLGTWFRNALMRLHKGWDI